MKSFFVIRTEVIRQQSAAWKASYGSIHPMIDFVATSQPELLNELKKLGYKMYFNEKVYYDQVAPYLDKDGLVIADLSSNLAEEYLASQSRGYRSLLWRVWRTPRCIVMSSQTQLSFCVSLRRIMCSTADAARRRRCVRWRWRRNRASLFDFVFPFMRSFLPSCSSVRRRRRRTWWST